MAQRCSHLLVGVWAPQQSAGARCAAVILRCKSRSNEVALDSEPSIRALATLRAKKTPAIGCAIVADYIRTNDLDIQEFWQMIIKFVLPTGGDDKEFWHSAIQIGLLVNSDLQLTFDILNTAPTCQAPATRVLSLCEALRSVCNDIPTYDVMLLEDSFPSSSPIGSCLRTLPEQSAESASVQPASPRIAQEVAPVSDPSLQEALDATRQGIRADFRTEIRLANADLLSRFVSEVGGVLLDGTRSVLTAIELETVDLAELRELVEQTLDQVKANKDQLAELVPYAQQAEEILKDPQFDVEHQIKLSIPIIPLLCSYEGTAKLASGANIRRMFEAMVQKCQVRKKDEKPSEQG